MPKKFVPRQRKHKVLARQKKGNKEIHADDFVADQPDSNALEIIPTNQKTLAAKKLREELKDQGVKVSGKKAKRLEKYIENKLKKDENRELLLKLSRNKIDTSLFSSTRNLGQGKETKRQSLQRALKEHAAGIRNGQDDEMFEDRANSDGESQGSTDGLPGISTRPALDYDRAEHGTSKLEIKQAPADAAASTLQLAQAGSGLKRPLELDGDGHPVIQKRQKRGGVASRFATTKAANEQKPEVVSVSDGEWSGFDSNTESTSEMSSLEDESSSEEGDEQDGSSAAKPGPEGDDSSEEDAELGDTRQRSSAFKAWAHQQRNDALGYKPVDSTSAVLDMPLPEDFKPRPLEQDPLPPELQPTINTERKAFSVPVVRSAEIQEARLQLPIVAEEQRIMEAIHSNDIVVICGATGSGKTTQVPQFLFEAGYGSPDSPTPGLIGVTQPRKVAAVSCSKRVGQELGNYSHAVAYQIRFEGTADDKTAIKFMTDGILLRELSTDIALRKYSAIVIDEAHERTVNTDVLIGMLSRSVTLRRAMGDDDQSVVPLKLIIMSATLKISDLTKNPTLFPTPPPVLDVEGREHEVTIHYARQTRYDYVDEAFKKISRGHRKLPPGGMLVFLTGHDEISRLSKKLKLASGGLNSTAFPKVRISANDAPLEVEDIEFGQINDTQDDYDEADLIDEAEGEDDDAEFDIPEAEAGTGPMKMHILALYSLLPTREQMRVFEPSPDGSRQVILATNIAETSLTIPGIRYVFDCGRVKERRFDKESGVQSYEVGWISKASASQRAGRAGRTGPGHCYRLFSSAVYERDLPQFADPELLRMPIEGVVLQLKAMRLSNVANFPFPTPISQRSLAKAERLLMYLSAITSDGQATDIGTTMARFPLPPRFARILLIGHLHECLPYTVALVAGLSVAEIFIPESQAVPALSEQDDPHAYRTNDDVIAETRQKQARHKYNEVHRNFRDLDDASDAIKLLKVVGEFAHDPSEEFCESHFVRFKALQETQKLRKQITSLLQKDIPAFANLTYQEKLDRPSLKQITALKQMVAAGFIDQVAIRGDLAPSPPEVYRKPRRAMDVAYVPLHPIDTFGQGDDANKAVYIHPSSVLAHSSPQECPDYIVYSHLQRAAPAVDAVKMPKTRMIALTDVSGAQLAALAKGTPLISYGKPIKEAKTDDPSIRECYVVPYLRAEGMGGQGWPLPAKKVTQKKVHGKGWVVQ
ncbi:P-loop containing nucleoside triphosphate hydrolase protein [Xylariales sp. AK1849]|nr:P-loop containing nucleoside triphosphate hydrolase protein [Xylariales sp. AK1849]